MMTRREVLRTAVSAGALVAVQGLLPAWARDAEGLQEFGNLDGGSREFDLVVGKTAIQVDGRQSMAVTVNGSIPGPLLRFREGETVTLRVRNELDEPTSIHWHGILVPFEMDGVPGVTFPGIPPGETFVYRYPAIPERHVLVPTATPACRSNSGTTARSSSTPRLRSRRVRPRARHRSRRLDVREPILGAGTAEEAERVLELSAAHGR